MTGRGIGSRARRRRWTDDDADPPVDLRLVGPALAGWAGCLVGLTVPGAWWAGGVAVAACAAAWAWLGGRPARRLRWGTLAIAGCAAAGCVVGAARAAQQTADPLVVAAEGRAWASVDVTVSGIPEPQSSFAVPDNSPSDAGEAGPGQRRDGGWRVTGTVVRADVAGRSWSADLPVVVHGQGADWAGVTPGSTLAVEGRLAPASAVRPWGVQVRSRSPPTVIDPAPWWQSAAQAIRSNLARQAAPLGGDAAGLLPGLVVGDTSGISPQLDRDARASGVAHLLAVSGSHFAIVCGAVMLAVRRAGPRWTVAAGAVTVAALVVLVGAEPSVLRAAVMSGVALLALLTGRARTALPALAACVLLLLLVDPTLAGSVGFLLSVLATGALVLLVPVWSGALQRRGWPPGWAAVVCVPVAAQVVTTPVIVAISGSIPVLGVLANVLVTPVVAAALLLGMACAILGPWWPGAAAVAAQAAGPPLEWIAWVAHRVAAWPGAVLPWPSTPLGVGAVAVGFVAAMTALRIARVRVFVAAGLAGAVVVLVPTGAAGVGWPPPGWLVVACEVGQGDALLIGTGEPATAIVVDAGPDPGLVDRCLDRLGIATVPLLVLTHLHADHVDGLPGILDGRSIGSILVGPGRQPAYQWAAVTRHAEQRGLPVLQWPVGTAWTSGALQLTVLGPERAFRGTDSDPNNDSVVLLARTAGVRILLTGDIEPPAQRALLSAGLDLAADVLKVPHHGSANTLPAFLAAVAPAIAVIGVGAENSYGHPNPALLRDLSRVGVDLVLRTDDGGDVAVVATDGGLAGVERGSSAVPP